MPSTLSFTVRRSDPELIVPANSTPHEFKRLSDIDDQEGLRFYSTGFHLYRNEPSKKGQDPCKVIRDALAKTLVYYYPVAGRIRELEDGKLVVECNGEGAVFVEADAGVRLEDFGSAPVPPFPCLDELLPEGGRSVINCPLFLIQVTRLQCGGFIFGLRISHTIADAMGVVQLLTAIAELADGAREPSVLPVWDRHLFDARSTPRITHSHPEYDPVDGSNTDVLLSCPMSEMISRTFFFGSEEIKALRRSVPKNLSTSSRFELVTAFVWRSRVLALDYADDDQVRVLFIVNARGRRKMPLPKGFYGNAFGFAVASATARELRDCGLGHAVELVKKAKDTITDEFMQSIADLMVIRGRPHFTMLRTYLVSDLNRAGFQNVDFGWGKGVYAGPASGGVGVVPGVASFYTRYEKGGEEGTLVPICLPHSAMDKFRAEIERLMTKFEDNTVVVSPNSE